ncbi:hypothetical protein Tco_0797576 [Tanacetum coccineum]
MAGPDDENPPPPPPPQTTTQQAPHTVSTIKLLILKKGEYDIWAMKMEHYLIHTDYPIWEVIQKGNGLNVVFVSSESTSSTNDVSTAYGVSTSSGYNSQRENSSSYTDELMYSFFANQSSGPQLDHEDLEQLDEFDLEEMDLKWQVAMISIRLKKFYKKTGRRLQFDAKEPVGFDKTKEEPKALVTLDGEGVDWTGHAEDEQENFALMAYSNSGSDTEVTSCSKECVESYAKLKKLYDEQREQLGDASIEIQAYTQALKKVEAQLVAHQKNQLWYEEKIRFMKIDLDDKTDVLTYHKKLLAEAVKEKEELKTKLENFQSSSKGLSKLLNSQMSTRDKSGLGYGNQIHEGVLSYEKEVLESVFDSRSSDVEDSPVNDRFAKVEGMHAVPPPMTGNYMPPKSDFGIDESNFTYGPKHVETLESVPEPVVVEPKVVSQPKVWSDAPIIEEYESDSDDEYVIQPSKEQEKPSFAFVNTVKHVKTPRETVKEQNTYSPSPKADKRDWNGLMSKRLGLGYGFTKKACFKGKGTGQGENRPVWNNVQRLNHQNKFVPKAVLTKTGKFPVNTARQNLSSQATTTSTARKVNTTRPIDNPQRALKNKGIADSGCFRHMTGNKAYLVEYQDYNGGHATYGDKLASAASLINTARPKLSIAQLGWCCSKVFNNGFDAWIGSKMQFGLDLRFWNTASSQTVNNEKQIHATIDSKAVVVTEASIRSSLLFNDVVGTACLTNEAIFQNLVLMGYEGKLNKLTFQKALFSPQWKYLIHTILHCLSSKSTSWNKFSTNIASVVICLATNQKFNFSKLIFDGMLRNLDNPKKKFLMYPRVLMVFLNNQIEFGEPFNDVYITPAHTLKVFSNMSRKGVKFLGKLTPLFDSMLVPHQAPEGEGSEQPTEP